MVFEKLNHFSSKQASKWFQSVKPFYKEQASKQRKFEKTRPSLVLSKQTGQRYSVCARTVVLGSHTCIVVLLGRKT